MTALPDDVEIVPKPMRKPVIRNLGGKPAIQKPATAPPSLDVTALPNDAEIVAKPVRKPVIRNPAGSLLFRNLLQLLRPVDVTALPNDVEIDPKSVRKPVIKKPAGKPVIQRADGDATPAGPHAKGQKLGTKKAEQKTGRSSTADVLAGGL